ncbi:Ankyrin repeat domain-containing protein 7 [Labeo rohita]|uniref:Ankyrin repeat domain-containing protein 7 n=1 Tax=Labeo rohita TaxID=84645 RepID=A0ABQ8MSA0_LABRO|nr:Ankyrin repeat domain-containing protein 7 [Labeo rohita]
MASAGLLFLLLVSSALLISTTIGPVSANPKQPQDMSPEKVNKVKEGFKATSRFVLENIDKITEVVCPFVELIPVCGEALSLVIQLVGVGVSLTNTNKDMLTLLDELVNLNTKLDHYQVEQTWNIWAGGAYHKPEMNIDVAWSKYTTLMASLRQTKDVSEKIRHKEDFKSSYEKFEPATKTLHKLLITKGTTFINPLGDLLAEHVNCHEKIIREYTMFIIKLIFRGNMMNHFYYRLKHIESAARIAEGAKIAYEAMSAMFQVHDYDRYDWMVVAFRTKKSGHKMREFMNRHVLSGFTKVTKDSVSVAVGRQVKGTHTKAVLVRQAIARCVDKSVLCYKVAKKLAECSEAVENKPVSQTYTAVHAYLREAHDSHNAQEVPDEDYEFSTSPEHSSPQTPYIYRGECQRSLAVKGGKFVVLIKSDEEIMTEDPCSKLDCGGNDRGSCVPVEGMFLAVCQCNKEYYGQNCEESLDDYRKYLEGTELMIKERKKPVIKDSRHRLVGSRQ